MARSTICKFWNYKEPAMASQWWGFGEREQTQNSTSETNNDWCMHTLIMQKHWELQERSQRISQHQEKFSRWSKKTNNEKRWRRKTRKNQEPLISASESMKLGDWKHLGQHNSNPCDAKKTQGQMQSKMVKNLHVMPQIYQSGWNLSRWFEQWVDGRHDLQRLHGFESQLCQLNNSQWQMHLQWWL